jgi:glyoxylase-like metal-dependent hydrolase (beta-lactamase superfamily II)
MNTSIITDGWLTAHSIKDDIWRISENGQDNLFLVLGNKKALVIDTGWGVSNLKEFIEKITFMPVISVNTHGHSDHALGNDVFDTVYAGEDDLKNFSGRFINERRGFIKQTNKLTQVEKMPDWGLWGSHAKKQELAIADGMEFDLGGRIITAWLTPGHSKGSVCFLDRKAGVLFTGDSFVPADTWGPAWFHLEDGAALAEYYEKMKSVTDKGGFDFLLSGHGESDLIPAKQLGIFLDGIKGVIEGKVQGKPEKTFAGDGLRCDWQGLSFIYNPERIF